MGIPLILQKLIDPIFQNKACIKLGTNAHYYIYPFNLSKSPIVYSAGVGNDISFEKDMIDKFNAKIFVFDPSPTGLITIKKNPNVKLRFYPLGVSEFSGVKYFNNPRNSLEGSYTLADSKTENGFPCTSFSDFAKKMRHRKIDLLKMDIEGFEYGVIRDILRSGLDIPQICLEFHHRFKNIPYSATINAILSLKKAGYRLIYKNVDDYTFLRVKKVN